jgi:hypothetical protein
MRGEVFQWIDPDTEIPVKIQVPADNWTVEYTNIHISPQPDELFEVKKSPDGKSYDIQTLSQKPGPEKK